MDHLLKAQAIQHFKMNKFQYLQALNKKVNHPDLPLEPLEPLEPPATEQELHLPELSPEDCHLHKDGFHPLKNYAQVHDKGDNVELPQVRELGPRVSPEPRRPPESLSGQRGRSCGSSTSPRLAPASRRAPTRTSPR